MRVGGRENADERSGTKAAADSGRRQPSAAPHAGSLLPLQSSLGNRAVMQMLRQAGHPGAQEEEHRHGAGCGHGSAQRPAVQRSAVSDVLRGAGRPLDPALRADLEPRMGADFSGVRVHDDAAAQASAAEVGARAYTAGNHIVIGKGGADRRTMAHELTHVIQQSRGPVAGTDNGSGLRISDPSDRFEREAEANAARVVSGPAPVQRRTEDAAHEAAPLRTVPGPSEVMVQRTVEDDLTADPRGFLAANMLSMDVVAGMKARWSRPALNAAYDSLGAILGGLTRHWFVLTADPRRQGSGPAYLLTPALEMYVADQEYQAAYPFLQALVGHPDLPPVQPGSSYLHSSYVPYLTGGASNPETQVGHTEIPREPGNAPGAGLVFTATMNGCAFAVTGSSQGPGMFRAWHYQSPGSRMADALEFQHAQGTMDWFGDEEYMGPGADRTLPEVTNMLSFGPNGWEILGQEVLASATDMSDARIGRTSGRPLDLEPADGDRRFGQAGAVYKGLAHKHLGIVTGAGEAVKKRKAPKDVQNAVTEAQGKVAAGAGGILIAGDAAQLYELTNSAVRLSGVTRVALQTVLSKHGNSKEEWIGKLEYFVETFGNYHRWLTDLRTAADRLRQPSA
ncbi:eCIS core domain-containing protein [Streptomyces nitrosporeus]|uniref:eCIS core domain-containing protein n=1 Tax=Streptomyces nitrosporeus TaxID=28894 RepID=UPI001E57830B|nr:DUF4157 domain-containing protein [Streptomyces nitrosporeus]